MMRGAVFLAAMAGVLTAVPAQAAESPTRELTMLGRCALATSVYASLVPRPPAGLAPTDTDRDLLARVKVAEPRLRQRAEALASQVPAEERDGIAATLKGQFQAQLAPTDGPRKTPREALDLYAPVLEACIVRADMIPTE